MYTVQIAIHWVLHHLYIVCFEFLGHCFFVFAGEDKIIIDHTEVNQGNEGKGFGKKMVTKAVEFAREKGIKILPLCPFAKSVFDKTPEFRDVL